MNFLGRMSRKMTGFTKTMIYKNIIPAQLDYCSSIMFMTTKKGFQKLHLLENQALIVILKKLRTTQMDI
jgi:hypothetical protein